MIGKLTLASLLGWGAWRWHKRHVVGPSYAPAPKGDAIDAIAARFGTTPPAIIAANGPGFARFYAPDGSPVTMKLPAGVKDMGAREGAQGRFLA